ncbi:MAG: DUF3050 domain-containing protein [Planctomycetota bacterium]
MIQSYESLSADLADLRSALIGHGLYARLENPEQLCRLLEFHVFAVWDFMSLAKALQRTWTCLELPWLPPEDPRLARFINEIILGEESDEDGRGGFASHYQLYLQAMRQAGANTGPIERLLLGLRAGRPIGECLSMCGAPPPSVAFVHSTFDTIATGDLPRIAASFTFGREDLLPGVFHRIVERLDQQTGGRFQILRYYLVRHMEVDGEHHGPLARRLMESACKTPEDWHAAASAARQALEARLALWDGIERALGSPV